MFYGAIRWVREIYVRERVLVLLGLLSVVLMLISGGVLYYSQGSLSVPVVLHQDHFLGTSILGDLSDVWGVWFLGLFMIVIDMALGIYMYYRERFMTYALFSISVFLGLLMLIIVGTILGLNI